MKIKCVFDHLPHSEVCVCPHALCIVCREVHDILCLFRDCSDGKHPHFLLWPVTHLQRLIRPSSSHRHTVLITRSMSPYPWSLFGYFASTRSLKIALLMDQPDPFKSGAAASAQKRALTLCSSLHSQVLRIASAGQQGPFWVLVVFPHISIPQTAEQELLMLAFQDGDHGTRVLFWIRGFPHMTKINNSEKDQNQDVLVPVSQSSAEWKEVWLVFFFWSPE